MATVVAAASSVALLLRGLCATSFEALLSFLLVLIMMMPVSVPVARCRVSRSLCVRDHRCL